MAVFNALSINYCNGLAEVLFLLLLSMERASEGPRFNKAGCGHGTASLSASVLALRAYEQLSKTEQKLCP